MMSSTKPPSGTRDFLPADIRRREYVIAVVRQVYERYGFEPLETPAFENIETLLGKYGEEGDKLIFKILRRGGYGSSGDTDLALRYDLTVPLARVMAQYQGTLPRFFKRYQIQPVWRADRPGHARFCEFYQCDIDATGSRSPIVEAEIIGAVGDVLTSLGFNDFKIHLNHRQLLQALLRYWSVPPQHDTSVLTALDKLDKIKVEGVLAELDQRGVENDCRTRIRNWLGAGFQTDWLNWLQENVVTLDPIGDTAFRNIREIIELLAPPDRNRVRVDLTLARGLAYYTGAIMEIVVPDLSGSLGGGGRYDNLVGMFSKQQVPACGFSLGLERILVVMDERKMIPDEITKQQIDIVIGYFDDQSRAGTLRLAKACRQMKLHVDTYPEANKSTGKQSKYAWDRGSRFNAVVGELGQPDMVAVRDMRSSQKEMMPLEEVPDYLQSKLQTKTLANKPQE